MAINTQELRKAYENGIEAVAALVENEVKRLSEKPKNHPPSNQPSKSMFTELNTSIPSVRRVHKMIQDKEEVEIKLVMGDSIRGTVKWIDSDCICVSGESGGLEHSLVIWQHAIAFIKTKS